MFLNRRFVAVAVAGVLLASQAQAHVELSQTSAPAGTVFDAVFGVGHGCDGAATTALRVLIDERLESVDPQPKDGWEVESSEHEGLGSDGAPRFTREVRWVGGQLGSHDVGEFVIVVKLPDAEPGTVIYFPIVQECGSAVHRWIETPLADEGPETLLEPAPYVTLSGAAR